jgi:hypothetical protein
MRSLLILPKSKLPRHFSTLLPADVGCTTGLQLDVGSEASRGSPAPDAPYRLVAQDAVSVQPPWQRLAAQNDSVEHNMRKRFEKSMMSYAAVHASTSHAAMIR